MSSAESRLLGFSAVPNSRSPAYSPNSQTRVRTDHHREGQERHREPAADPVAQRLDDAPSGEGTDDWVRDRARLARADGRIDPYQRDHHQDPEGDGEEHSAGYADDSSRDEPGEAHRAHDRRAAILVGDEADGRASHQG
jgi:hypothetical protein